MNDNLKKIFDQLKRQSLSEHERSVLREQLKLFMLEHPARVPALVRAVDEVRTVFSFSQFTSVLRFQPALLALVLVLTVGIGTSYAAEGALPGDTLYPIKVNVNESVQGALMVSDRAKADWIAARVARRLEEAEALAARGKLTAEHSIALQTKIEDSTEDFNAKIAVLAKEEQDSETVVDAQSNLEATLNAHAHVLAALSDVVPESREQLKPILAKVLMRAEGAKHSRTKAEAAVARKGSAVRAAAVAKRDDAEGTVSEVRLLAAEVETTLGASSSQKASTSAFNATQKIEAGKEHLEKGDFGNAFNTFEAAIREAREAKVNVDAHVRLKGDIDLPVNGVGTSSEDHSGSDGEDD